MEVEMRIIKDMGYKVKAVIFDQDGLMFDTERLSVEGWDRVGAKYGVSVDNAFLDALRGGKRDTTLRLMKERFGEDFPCEEFLAEKRAYSYRQIEERGVPVMKGLRELLTYLKEHGCKTAVATSSNSHWTEQNVRGAGLWEYFDVYTYGDMVRRAKPDPEIFYLAAERLGEEPGKCIVLEDSFNGINGALNGGFLPVMVPDLSIPGPELISRLTAKCDSLLDVISLFETGFFEFEA